MFESLRKTTHQAAICYHLPGDSFKYAILGEWHHEAEANPAESYFYMHPFSVGENNHPLRFKVLQYQKLPLSANIELPTLSLAALEASIQSTNEHAFEEYVLRIQQQLEGNRKLKIVAARKKVVRVKVNAIEIFNQLITDQPDAFVSLVYIPGLMCWMGASPEVLLQQLEDGRYETYSLAGTRTRMLGSSKTWGKKEIEEQKIVSEYLWSTLDPLDIDALEFSDAETVEAGDLQHLRSRVRFRAHSKSQFNQIARLLHPTPAVCGWPKAESLEFIKKNEGMDRQYYSGYWGPVNIDGKTAQFVNLRCMQLFDDAAVLYAGCGVTALSNAKAEWDETEWKTQILGKLLRDMNKSTG